MKTTTFGLDIAKRAFQMYWVEAETGEIVNRRFTKQQLIEFLGQRAPGRVALEACGSAHWWARKIVALGHEVVLLHARFIRPFVQNNKTDATDARAIWTAAQQPGMRSVAPKTADQQATLALHRMRSLLVKSRTMQVNQLRGLLYEFGVTLKVGRVAGLAEVRERLHEIEQVVPGALFCALCDQLQHIDRIDGEIKKLERQIVAWQRQEAACQRVAAIPGIGPLTATALVATIGDPAAFKSGRELAAYLGLVPRQNGTGGKVRLGAISKRGDNYIRMLLIHGARAVLFKSKSKGVWCERLLARRPVNVATVALANKMARTAWALLAKDRTYQKDYAAMQKVA
ncbi:IS110 family transposase [Caballeronia sordidicola]|uniref:Mobile element protein n=1 Tax=Caballeronia sordidicola TaxID=196367 RepID=A0A226WXX8_CABSO|nr:IS110 family transposase [Caballeronia sordidicola]OXC76066.1 Mobile element protein [Caballeronia sordidicola]